MAIRIPKTVWAGITLVAATFLVYLPVLHGGFIWDDDILVTTNPLVRNPGGLAGIWRGDLNPDYFPLTSTLFWLEYRAWGAWATGYHCVNILLHSLAALLVWRLLLRLRVPWAWMGALLFALHPVAVATVAWISEGKNTLSMVLALAAAIFFLTDLDERRGRFPLLASFICFLLALLAKTSIVMLPVVLLLLMGWRTGKITRRDILRASPFFALSLVMGLVTMRFQAERAIVGAAIPVGGFFERFAASARALAWYFFQLLAPLHLDVIHPPIGGGLFDGIGIPVTVLAVVVAWWFRRSRLARGFLFGFAAFAAMLLPILGWIRMYYFIFAPVADHLAYAAIPVATAMVAGAAGGIAQSNAKFRAPAGAVVTLLALAFAYGGFVHGAAYHDSASLWSCAIKQNPGSFEVQSGYALAMLDEGRLGEALQHGQLAVRQNPGFLKSRLNLGLMYDRVGQFDQSISEYTTAIGMDPSEPSSHLALAHVFIEAGDYSRAIAELTEGLRLDPSDAGGHNNLGLAFEKSGSLDQAIVEYRTAANLEPDFPPYRRNLAALLFRAGRMPEAAVEFAALVRLEPGSADCHNDLGAALRESGRADEARAQFRDALRLDPADSMARDNLERMESGNAR